LEHISRPRRLVSSTRSDEKAADSLAPFTIVSQGRTIPATALNKTRKKISNHFIIQMIDNDDKRFKVIAFSEILICISRGFSKS